MAFEGEIDHTGCMTGVNVVEIIIYNSGVFSALLAQIQGSHIRIIA
jgi:hypothetical protein